MTQKTKFYLLELFLWFGVTGLIVMFADWPKWVYEYLIIGLLVVRVLVEIGYRLYKTLEG